MCVCGGGGGGGGLMLNFEIWRCLNSFRNFDLM